MNSSLPVDPTQSRLRSNPVASLFLLFLFQTTRDRLGQPLCSVEALGTPAQRVTRFRWRASGQMSHLILENPATGEQVTEWLFGTTLATSGVARNDLVSGKVWPTGESESYLFNRQSDLVQRTDPNGSVRQFTYDKLGRPLDDAATTVAAEVDATMRRVSTDYNNRGQRDTVTTYDAASGGAVINQVKFEYDAFGLQTADRQAHDGPVDGSTPSVSYTYTNGSGNVLRRTSVTAPSGKQVDYAYGSGGSLDDVLNRVASLKIHDDTPNLVEKRRGIGAVLDKPLGLPAGRRPQVGGLSRYTWAGFGRLVTLKYPVPNAELSYLTAGAFNGDAGDPMTGYDRFGRTTRMPWKNGGTVLADIAYGYDRAGRRTWRQDLTPAAQASFDRAYGYDALGQVKSADRGTLNSNRTAIGGIPKEAEAWQYDEQGNWLAYDKAEDGASVIDQSRRSNVSNQIVTIDGSNEGVAYDKNGNMIRIPTGDALTGAPRKLVWNAWDQLVEVRVESSNALLQRNAYDGLFRRTTRTLADDSVIHCYYNDQWKPIEERIDAATDPLAVYFWGARPGHRDDLIRRDRDTDGNGLLDETLWCLMDYFDPIAILNSSGAVQERFAYSAFGVPLILAPDYAARSGSSFVWDFLFHGQFTDAETGCQNYGYRFYFPELGTWHRRDPIRNRGGSNLYSFSVNSAVNHNDLFGLITVESEIPRLRDVIIKFGRGGGSYTQFQNCNLSCNCREQGGCHVVKCAIAVSPPIIRIDTLQADLNHIHWQEILGHEEQHVRSRITRIRVSVIRALEAEEDRMYGSLGLCNPRKVDLESLYREKLRRACEPSHSGEDHSDDPNAEPTMYSPRNMEPRTPINSGFPGPNASELGLE